MFTHTRTLCKKSKRMENSILLCFLLMLETQMIFKLSVIQISYICNEKKILSAFLTEVVMLISSGRLCKVLVQEEVAAIFGL